VVPFERGKAAHRGIAGRLDLKFSTQTPAKKTRYRPTTIRSHLSGAVGLNLQLSTEIKGQPATFAGSHQYWDSLQIGVYQRHSSEQRVGDASWIIDNSTGVYFDGRRLLVKLPKLVVSGPLAAPSIDLDLTYENDKQVWDGWFHRGSFARRVILTRPHVKAGIAESRLVGTCAFAEKIYEEFSDPNPETSSKIGEATKLRRIRDYGGIEQYMRLRVEEREKRTGKKLTLEDLP
jgi:hypothetical protein